MDHRISLIWCRRAFEELAKGRSSSVQAVGTNEEHKARVSGIPKRLPYRKQDYLNIKFWTRKNYEDAKNMRSTDVIRTSTGNTINLGFVEHEDGSPITEGEAVKIRETARSIFAQLLQDGTAPAKWGQVSIISQEFFFNVLAERFPYVAMCEDMWKAQLIATTCYPSWHRNNKEKLEKHRREQDRQERERIWTAQQLEHARQVEVVGISGRESKAELIDHADHLEFKSSKRNLSVSQDGSAPGMRPNKKAKSIGSGGGAKNPAPPKASTSSVIPNPSFPAQRTTSPPPPSNIASSVQHHVPAVGQSPNEMLPILRTDTPVPSFNRAISPTYGANSTSDGACTPESPVTRPIQPSSGPANEGAFYTMPDESGITGFTLDDPSVMGGKADSGTFYTMPDESGVTGLRLTTRV